MDMDMDMDVDMDMDMDDRRNDTQDVIAAINIPRA